MSVLVFDEAAEVTRITHEIESWVLVFDELAALSVQQSGVDNDFLVFDGPPPIVTVTASPQDFLLIDEPAPPPATISDGTGEDVIVITAGGPTGPVGATGEPGPPGADGSGTSYDLTFNFASASTLWSIAHNLNTIALEVHVFDHNGDLMLAEVRYPDGDHIEVAFYYPTTGSARVFR